MALSRLRGSTCIRCENYWCSQSGTLCRVPRSSLPIGLSLSKNLERRAIRIVLHNAFRVEDHRLDFISTVSGPRRKPRMIRITLASKIDPCIGYSTSKIERFGTTAGHYRAPFSVIENEWQLRTMVRARTAIEHRRLPLEPVHVSRSGTLRRLALCLFKRVHACAQPTDAREQIKRRLLRICLLVCGQ